MTQPGQLETRGLSAREVRLATRAMQVGVAAAAVAVSAQFAVPMPFSPVPATLQPVAVLAVGALLGPRLALAALVAYLAMGMAGLPVFSMGRGGIAHLFGPTGGYLLAFPVAAWLAGLGGSRRLLTMLPAMAGAMVAIHAGGAAWLAILGNDARFAFEAGFVPFLTGDLLKIGLAMAIALLLGPRIRATR